CLEGVKQQACGQGQVEEDMRNKNAGQAVNALPLSAVQPPQQVGENSCATEQRKNSKRGNDCRQGQRQGEEPQNDASAWKVWMPGKGAGDQDCGCHRKQGRQEG